MIRRSLLRGALLASALLASPGAFAQALVGGTVLNGGVPSYNVNATAPFTIDQGTLALRVFVVNGTGGGGGGGGTSGPYYVGQYNSTLPSFTSGQAGYLSVDGNGRMLIAPSSFPASQAVTNAGTFAVQNTAPVVGGNSTAVKTDGSAVTQPVSAASLPLPSGAATAANQSSEIAALGTTGDAAYAGSGTASIIAALKGVYTATLAPLAAGTNTIGSINNISGTVSLPTGAATAANQSTEITALQAIQQRALLYLDFNNTTAAANGTVSSAIRDLGASPNYTKVNLVGFSNQSGTYKILGCQDSACATPLTLAQSAITANGYVTITAPVITRYYLLQYTNGATAGSVYANTSFTAN